MRPDYPEWKLEDWNQALFHHIFFDSDGDDIPVHRIYLSPEELTKAASEMSDIANEVQDAFISVIKNNLPFKFQQRLSRYCNYLKASSPTADIPAFFADLAFTCLVASPTDDEIIDEGNYRKRLASLLGNELSPNSYHLNELPELWGALSSWLDRRRSLGEQYRRLELPPTEKWRRLIGYSINLAFPPRKDLLFLAQLFSDEGVKEEPPITFVFELIGKVLNRFSENFKRAFNEFREAFKSHDRDLASYPFWGAVREALSIRPSPNSVEVGSEKQLKLIMEPKGDILLLSDSPGEIGQEKLSFEESDTPYGDFKYVLCARGPSPEGFKEATIRFLNRKIDCALSRKWFRRFNIYLEQGFLLFRRTEDSLWEWAPALNENDEYRGLIKNYLTNYFRLAIPIGWRPGDVESIYRGWTEIDPFTGGIITSIDFSKDRLLRDIVYLQPIVSSPKISIVGGCRTDNGYLGIPACLPNIRATNADAVSVTQITKENEKKTIDLMRVSEDSIDFRFSEGIKDTLNGSYMLVSSFSGRVLKKKQCVFRPDIVVNNYTTPTEPASWEMEAGGPDVVIFGQSIDGLPHHTRKDPNRSSTKKNPQSKFFQTTDRSWRKVADAHLQSKSRTPLNNEIRTDLRPSPKAFRLMEIMGGMAMRRKGIPEHALLDLVQTCLDIDSYGLSWDVVRAWMEAGHVDRLHYRKWRRTEYYPRRPRFILEHRNGFVRGVLAGLATEALRNRTDVELQGIGADRDKVGQVSELIVPAPVWLASSAGPYFQVSEPLGLEEPVWLPSIEETLWPMSEIMRTEQPPPEYYERHKSWDWERGEFRIERETGDEGISITRFIRPDRPPYYMVTMDGDCVWWSTCRNWSILLAYRLKGINPFSRLESNAVTRESAGQVYLPLPIGRHLAMTSSVIAGPVTQEEESYVYFFRDSIQRRRLLASIWGTPKIDSTSMRRWARWIMSLSRRSVSEPGAKVVSIPLSIRCELKAFGEIPEFENLINLKTTPAIMPRLRHGIRRYVKRNKA